MIEPRVLWYRTPNQASRVAYAWFEIGVQTPVRRPRCTVTSDALAVLSQCFRCLDGDVKEQSSLSRHRIYSVWYLADLLACSR